MPVEAPDESFLGIGLYGVGQAARLIGVSRGKMSRWAYGYSHAEKFSQPLISHDITLQDEKILSFLDLIELHFVAMFRREGVTMPTIRAAARHAEKIFDTKHPFAVRRFSTDGKQIFATLVDDRESIAYAGADDRQLLVDLNAAQMVMRSVAEIFFRKLKYDDAALSYWPEDPEGGVVLDPERHFGQPILDAHGIPTHALYKMSRIDGIENTAEWYGIPVRAVEQALRFEMRQRSQI